MAMELKIQREGELERRLTLDRLVSTVGFGEGCDVVLAAAGRTERLGMFIQQGEVLNFRPLHSPSGVFMDGREIESMVSIPMGVQLRILDYDLAWGWEQERSESSYEAKRPPVASGGSLPLAGYKAGAMSAYGQTPAAKAMEAEEKGAELEWSHQALQAAREMAGQTGPAREPYESRLERETAKPSESPSSKALGAAESELARKLEEARQRMEGGMRELSESLDASMGLEQGSVHSQMSAKRRETSKGDSGRSIESFIGEHDDGDVDLLPGHADVSSLQQKPVFQMPRREELYRSEPTDASVESKASASRELRSPVDEGEEDGLLPMRTRTPKAEVKGKSKDVLKHYFNHLDMDVFYRPSPERRIALMEGLKVSLMAVMGEGETSPLFPKMEQELKSSGPLKALINDDTVKALMIRDKGNLYVDRGKGFVEPELSFFNSAQAYWSLDRLLLGSGVKLDWRGGMKSFRLDESWGGRVIMPENSWQGAYAVLSRRKEQRTQFVMNKADMVSLAERVRARENLLVVSPSASMAQDLAFWFLKQAESLGPVLVLSRRADLASSGEHPRRIGVSLGDEPLGHWVQWSEGMDLAGMFHYEPLEDGFELLKSLAHQQHGWWQLMVANGSKAAVEKCELEMALSHSDLRPDLIKKLLNGAFDAVLSIDGKSISGRKHRLKIESIGLDARGEWAVPADAEKPSGDWGD